MITLAKSIREISLMGARNKYINTPSMMTSGQWASNMKIRGWSDDLLLSVLLLSLPFHLLLTHTFTNIRVLNR